MKKSLSTKLAKALYQLSQKNQNSEVVFEQLLDLSVILNQNNFIDSLRLLSGFSVEDLSSTVDKVFGKVLLQEMKNLLVLLISSSCLDAFDEILEVYQRVYFSDQKIADVQIVTAKELDTAKQEELRQKFNEKRAGKSWVNFSVNQSLIGGMQVFENGVLSDFSLSAVLGRLRHEIITKN